MNFYLNEKIKTVFPEESILKSQTKNPLGGLAIPSFIKDWLVKKFTNIKGELDVTGMLAFCDEHLPKKGTDIKARLLQRESITLLSRFTIEIDIKGDCFRFGLPDLGIKTSNGIIAPQVIRNNPKITDGDIWGIGKLRYAKDEYDRGYISLESLTPFKPYEPNLQYYKEARRQFSTEEWIDFLIADMEYNPEAEGFNSLSTKLLFLSRLLVFVENNINLVELAPKGTGKSYVFNNLSKHGWQISGGKITRAKLFYDMAKQMPGLFANFDFLAMDEIKTISFENPSELQGALKNYLEQGTYTVGNTKTTSSCGLILLGNIALTSDKQPVSPRYFEELPDVFSKDTALIDRFHGFLEGWKLPRLTSGSFFEGYSLNLEYFSEILSALRSEMKYAAIVEDKLIIPEKADARDVKAIKKLCSGYLKLLFPQVEKATDISAADFRSYCFEPAFSKRAIIRRQLCLMDPEFSPSMPAIKVKEDD